MNEEILKKIQEKKEEFKVVLPILVVLWHDINNKAQIRKAPGYLLHNPAFLNWVGSFLNDEKSDS